MDYHVAPVGFDTNAGTLDLPFRTIQRAADVMQAHPIALQLRNLQTLLEISAEKNSTIIFPAQFFTSIQDLKRFVGDEGPGVLPKA